MDFDVFISYSSKDATAANAVCAALEAAKIRCWIAPRDIQPSVEWAASIMNAIARCRAMVIVFSSNANQSKQVHREVQQAFDKEVPVIPFRIENVAAESSLAFYLGPVHWLDALTPPLEQHLHRLTGSVLQVLGRPPITDSAIEQGPSEVEAQQAFAKAKREDTVAALDAFIAAYPASHLIADAQTLRAALAERDEAYRAAMASDDAAVLKAFLERYPKGKPADDVRKRLRRLERPQRWRPSRRAVLISGGVVGAGALAGAAAIVSQSDQQEGSKPPTTPAATPSRYLIRTFGLFSNTISSIAIAPDGRTVLSGNRDSFLTLWDIASGKLLKMFDGHHDAVTSVVFAPDGRTALTGSWDHTLRLWDLSTGTTVRTFSGHTAPVISIAIAPDGLSALSASLDDTLRLWNVSTGSTIRSRNTEGIDSVAIGGDGHAALFGGNGYLTVCDAKNLSTTRTLKPAGLIRSIAVSRDGRHAFAGGGDEYRTDFTLRLWDLLNGTATGTIPQYSPVLTVAIAPDNRTAISGGDNKALFLWDLASFKMIRGFVGHGGAVTCAAIAPDGRTMVSGSADKTLKLWDLT